MVCSICMQLAPACIQLAQRDKHILAACTRLCTPGCLALASHSPICHTSWSGAWPDNFHLKHDMVSFERLFFPTTGLPTVQYCTILQVCQSLSFCLSVSAFQSSSSAQTRSTAHPVKLAASSFPAPPLTAPSTSLCLPAARRSPPHSPQATPSMAAAPTSLSTPTMRRPPLQKPPRTLFCPALVLVASHGWPLQMAPGQGRPLPHPSALFPPTDPPAWLTCPSLTPACGQVVQLLQRMSASTYHPSVGRTATHPGHCLAVLPHPPRPQPCSAGKACLAARLAAVGRPGALHTSPSPQQAWKMLRRPPARTREEAPSEAVLLVPNWQLASPLPS